MWWRSVRHVAEVCLEPSAGSSEIWLDHLILLSESQKPEYVVDCFLERFFSASV